MVSATGATDGGAQEECSTTQTKHVGWEHHDSGVHMLDEEARTILDR